MDSARFHFGLAELREAHAANLQRSAGELEAICTLLREPLWDSGAAKDLRRLSAGLVEMASRFAYAELGAPAHALEQALVACEPDVVPSPASRRAVDDAASVLALGIRLAAGRARSNPPPPPEPSTSKRVVEVVDVDVERALQLERTLDAGGYAVALHASPRSLGQALARRSPVAAIVDLDLFREPPWGEVLSRVGGARGVPLFCLSRDAGMRARLAAARAGASAFLVSPPDGDGLLQKLEVLTMAGGREPYRVLLVETGDLSARYAEALRAAGIAVTSQPDPLDVVVSLADVRPDLVVIDDGIAGGAGLAIAQALREEDANAGLPVVLLVDAGVADGRFGARGILVEDVLRKPEHALGLVEAVKNRIRRARVLHSLITCDGLTGLLNRGAILRSAEVEILRAARKESPLAAAMIDVDHFKRVNDEHGHAAGDRVLQALANTLEQHLRRIDVVGRCGGEEFLVLFPDTTAEQARVALDGVREVFGRTAHRTAAEGSFWVTFSAGIAVTDRGCEAGVLTGRADAALYEAKRAGRNRCRLFGAAE